MKIIHTLPTFLAIAACTFGQTPTPPKSTPTPFEALVLKQPASAIQKQLVGRLTDGPNSVTVSTVSVQSEGQDMQGLELVIATASKCDALYLDRDRLQNFLKIVNRDVEQRRTYIVNKRKERGATTCWAGFDSNIAGDPPDVRTITPGWLVSDPDNPGTMIQVSYGLSGFHCELPSTPLPKFVELVSRGLAQFADKP